MLNINSLFYSSLESVFRNGLGRPFDMFQPVFPHVPEPLACAIIACSYGEWDCDCEQPVGSLCLTCCLGLAMSIFTQSLIFLLQVLDEPLWDRKLKLLLVI